MALAERLKWLGRRVDLVDGRGPVANEQWTTWAGAWRGWRKSVYGEGAPQPLRGLLGGMLLAYGLGPLVVCWAPSAPAPPGDCRPCWPL